MSDYNALKTELLTDPMKLGYANLSDSAANDALNALTQPVANPLIPLSKVAIWAAPSIRAKLQAHATNTASPVQSICLTVLDLLSGLSGPPLDLSNASNQGMMQALIQAGVMTQADAAALTALGQSKTSRALLLPGWGVPVQAPDVTHARSL